MTIRSLKTGRASSYIHDRRTDDRRLDSVNSFVKTMVITKAKTIVKTRVKIIVKTSQHQSQNHGQFNKDNSQ